MGAMSIWHWLVVLAIVVLVFGTKKLRNMGGDLGGAIKNFKGAMKEGEDEAAANSTSADNKPEELDSKSETAQKKEATSDSGNKV